MKAGQNSPRASSHSSEGGNDEAATAVLMSLLEVIGEGGRASDSLEKEIISLGEGGWASDSLEREVGKEG